ncbi:MAG TPA: hypothetical protein PL029_02055 [Bacteroidia bacterium]|nr:hypothetical protein [Bacteroidia bacterium]
MNLLRRRTTWSNAELAVFKAAVFTAGIIAGSYIHNRIGGYMNWLWTFTAATSLVSLYLWIVKSKPRDRVK